MTTADGILSIVKQHDQWRQRSLNLIPSENVMSPAARSLLSSDFGHRYTAPDKFYMGTRFLDELQQTGEDLAKRVFDSEIADLRPLSGHVADLIFLSCFTKPGDTILCVSAADGGYPGIWKEGLPRFLKLRPLGFPFSKATMNIKVDEAKDLVRNRRPRAVIFGQSLFLFPHPVKELIEAARDVDATVGYDGSHVLGLVAGKGFQDPLHEGASVLFGSTHKSFFGPQGGIIVADKEHGEIIKSSIFPGLVDNAHWNRVAALTLSLTEMLHFGRDYATQVIENAQTLAKALAEKGFPVSCPSLKYTKSHQTILDFGGYDQGRKIAERLERANIIVDCAVRVGTPEVTRRGMKGKEMLQIAEFAERALGKKESLQKVRSDVEKFMDGFQDIMYCFK